jgi:hypothetical protein
MMESMQYILLSYASLVLVGLLVASLCCNIGKHGTRISCHSWQWQPAAIVSMDCGTHQNKKNAPPIS